MDPSYAAAYRDLYERHWWWRAREKFLLDRLASQAKDDSDPTRHILDVGCGDALFFDRLSAFGHVEGIEPDATVISDGPWRERIHAGTLESFSSDVAFDWILMLDVLEHMPDPRTALLRARKIASEQASLFITVPAFQSLWTRHDELNQHYLRYNRTTLGNLLAESGWQPVEMGYFFHWLAPMKLLLKATEKLSQGRPRVEEVPAGAINRLAYAVSRTEQQLWWWLSIPVGTSLYARAIPTEPTGFA